MTALNISDTHKTVLDGYCELSRYQRQQYLRSVESCINDVIDTKMIEDTYTKDEVMEILMKIQTSVGDELEAELIEILQSNVLMLCQLFKQAEKWHLQLSIDLSEIQNKDLQLEVNNIENAVTHLKRHRPKLTPICTTDVERTSEGLRLEISALKEENIRLGEDVKSFQNKIECIQQDNEKLISACEEKNKLIEKLHEQLERIEMNSRHTENDQKNVDTEKILEDYDNVLREQIANELKEMKKKVDAAQSQLKLAEMELEKKFNKTAAYRNMMQIITKKNEQIKDLRNRLLNYECVENLENIKDDDQ